MNIYIIVACDQEKGIGKNNTMPWRNSNDMRFFQETTIGAGNNAILMGRNTYESIPNNKIPLHSRKNIVISSKMTESEKDIAIFRDIDYAIKYCEETKIDNLWIIGGGSIYDHFMNHPKLDRIFVSNIKGDYECDVFFPQIPDTFVQGYKMVTHGCDVDVYLRSK